MKYLFAFADMKICKSLQAALKEAGIACEIRTAQEFPDGTQGPELWVRDEDYNRAENFISELLRER